MIHDIVLWQLYYSEVSDQHSNSVIKQQAS